MNAGWLLDTSALAVAHQAPVAEQLNRLLRAGLLYSCPVTDLEALSTASTPEEYRELAADRRDAYRPVAISSAVGERALALQGRLIRRDRHRPVAPRDLLVAATAIEHTLTLLHHDPVFEFLGEFTALAERSVLPLGGLS